MRLPVEPRLLDFPQGRSDRQESTAHAADRVVYDPLQLRETRRLCLAELASFLLNNRRFHYHASSGLSSLKPSAASASCRIAFRLPTIFGNGALGRCCSRLTDLPM